MSRDAVASDRGHDEVTRLREELRQAREELRRTQARLDPLARQVLRFRAEATRRQKAHETLLARRRYQLVDRVAELAAVPARRWRRSRTARPLAPRSLPTPPDVLLPDDRVALIVAFDLPPVALEALAGEVGELAARSDVRPVFVVNGDGVEALVHRRIEFEVIPPRHPWTDQTGGDYGAFVVRRLQSICDVYRPQFVASASEQSDADVIDAALQAAFR